MGTTVKSIAVLTFILLGCSSENTVSRCTPGEVVACPCGDGTRGVQTCSASAAFGTCVCADGGSMDVQDVFIPRDAPVATDAPDAAPLLDAPAAPDVSVDAGADAAIDAGPDAGADAATDAPSDVSCADGSVCQGACTDTSRDPHNCGRCGNDCTALTGVVADAVRCVAGACDVTGACLPSRAHCTAAAGDGCETDVTSPARCGACGNRCADPQPFCSLLVDGAGVRRYACASDCGRPRRRGAADAAWTSPPTRRTAAAAPTPARRPPTRRRRARRASAGARATAATTGATARACPAATSPPAARPARRARSPRTRRRAATGWPAGSPATLASRTATASPRTVAR